MQFSAVRCVVNIAQQPGGVSAEKQFEKELQQKQELKLRKAKVWFADHSSIDIRLTVGA